MRLQWSYINGRSSFLFICILINHFSLHVSIWGILAAKMKGIGGSIRMLRPRPTFPYLALRSRSVAPDNRVSYELCSKPRRQESKTTKGIPKLKNSAILPFSKAQLTHSILMHTISLNTMVFHSKSLENSNRWPDNWRKPLTRKIEAKSNKWKKNKWKTEELSSLIASES